MPFEPKSAKKKGKGIYKSLNISEDIAEQVDKLAAENGTSFNNMVVSMIEYCLKEMEEQ